MLVRGEHLSTQLRTIQDDTTKKVPSGSHYLVTMYVDMFRRGVGEGGSRERGGGEGGSRGGGGVECAYTSKTVASSNKVDGI